MAREELAMFGIRPKRELHLLRRGYREIDALLALGQTELERAAPAVSSWSPGRHIWHVCRVNSVMFGHIRQLLEEPQSASQEGGLTPIGRLVLLFRWIPRGRGQAPEAVLPPDTPGTDELKRTVEESRGKLLEVESLCRSRDSRRWLRHGRKHHFVFGELTAIQWLCFGRIHTRHHLRIVRDIQRAL